MLKNFKNFKENRLFFAGAFCFEVRNKESHPLTIEDDSGDKEEALSEAPDSPAYGIRVDVDKYSDKNAESQGSVPVRQTTLPERKEGALSADQFKEEYKKVQKDPEARAKLILDQVAKGNFPPGYRHFETITVKAQDGTALQFSAAKRRIRFGESDDTAFEVPMDGKTSQMVADMLGGSLPNKFFADKIY